MIKKFTCFFLVIILLIMSLTGCSRTDLLNLVAARDSRYNQQMVDDLFLALDNNHKEDLKSLFAISVIDSNENLDAQIDELMEFYKGPKESDEGVRLISTSEHMGPGEDRLEIYNSFTVTAGGIKYHVSMKMIAINEENRDEEGLRMLEFATEEAYESKYFSWHFIDDDIHGVYVKTSPEKRNDVMVVEKRKVKYTPVNRTLTETDFLKYVKNNDSFSGLISTIGEANADWINFGFYYFELSNKLIVVCNVEDEKIKYLYVANEDEELYTLWIPDDMIKVHGSYNAYTFVDRELTEDVFLSFVKTSRDLKELHDKIGPPTVDTSFYSYYQLPDGSFIGCHHAGYKVKEIFIADSEKRLNTIWKYEDK